MTTPPLSSNPTNGPSLRLYHGTDVASARDLVLNGVDATHAAVYNGSGEFWACTVRADADIFAQVNPAGGPPARFEFDLPEQVLQGLLNEYPTVVYQHGATVYECLPSSFAVLNLHMMNRQAHPVP